MTNETQVPKAPPAPEVALRTLSSDAKSVAAGEIDPQPELVTPPAEGMSKGRVQVDSQASANANQQEQKTKAPASTTKKIVLWALVIILVLAIIAVIMFWLLPKFSGGSSVEVTVPTEKA